MSIVRVLFAVASIKNWYLHQLDVNNALFHVYFEEDVYMSVPLGVKFTKPNQNCKLVKEFIWTEIGEQKVAWEAHFFALEAWLHTIHLDYSMFTLVREGHIPI